MMKNNKIRNWLRAGTLSLTGLFALNNANAQEPVKPGYVTQRYCKFINQDTELVVNFTDTLKVHKIYPEKYYMFGNNWMACDVSHGDGEIFELRFNPEFLRTMPWLPPIQYNDSVAFKLMDLDKTLVDQYYYYQNKHDYQNRDLIEQKIIENRKNLTEWAMARLNER